MKYRFIGNLLLVPIGLFLLFLFFGFVLDFLKFFADVNGVDSDNVSIQLLIALGTIGAVIVALFKDVLFDYFNKPKLRLEVDKRPLYIFNIPQEEGGNAVYFRLKVYNDGRTVAKNVAVLLKAVRGDNIYGKEIKCDYDMYLNSSNLGDNTLAYPNIQSNTGMYWDLGMMPDPEYRAGYKEFFKEEQLNGVYRREEPAISISLTYKLPVRYYVIGLGRYEFDVVITADHTRPIERKILLDFSRLLRWPERIVGHDDEFCREYEEKKISEAVEFSVLDYKSRFLR